MNSPDAVVIGAGPNGLVAANVLADAGWTVRVLEANAEPGGAVRTAEVTAPGFRNDLFSAFYPFSIVSPPLNDLRLDEWGLRWTHAPDVLAHPLPASAAAVMHRSLDDTVARLEAQAPGDGAAYRRLVDSYSRVADPLIAALLRPFPPLRPGLRLARASGLHGMRELARLSVLSLRRLVQEQFTALPASMLLAGCALHADLSPESAGSGVFGWLLLGLGQTAGFPVPVGGASGIIDALVRRAEAGGVTIECGRRVDAIEVRGGKAIAVVTSDGERMGATRAVLADCDAVRLFTSMVPSDALPDAYLRRIERAQRGSGTFKIDWAIDGAIPWADDAVRRAGTVHIADDLDELTLSAAELAMQRIPARPFLLVGQMTTADETRSPAGTEAAWAYTHVPAHPKGDAGEEPFHCTWDVDDRARMVERMERRIEAHAPGFRDRIIARHVMAPADLEAADANLVDGDIGGGTAQLHQQLVFRPVPGWARPETPVRRLYLASASAHPGGAVHGACGANAARAAIAHHRIRR